MGKSTDLFTLTFGSRSSRMPSFLRRHASQLAEQEEKSSNRANIASTKAKALTSQVLGQEERIKELEAELWDWHNSVIELEEQVGDCEAEVTKIDEYIALLEDRFAEATAKAIRREGQISVLRV